ncbi:MAG TPA: flagellar hook-basal body complex protein FliE [Casimicrobiaceae bacterium]|nr:flagellar hook-basal body complex protein FliE [Casimicrobiaceae bacterium]
MPIDPVSMDALLAKMNAMRDTVQRTGAALSGAAPVDAPASAKGGGSVDFAATLKASIAEVDAAQKASAAVTQRFQLGDPQVSLEETMVAMAKANLSFQQMVQVRNKVVAAYQDIMNMPI